MDLDAAIAEQQVFLTGLRARVVDAKKALDQEEAGKLIEDLVEGAAVYGTVVEVRERPFRKLVWWYLRHAPSAQKP
jgi:hypothetical protein